MKSNDTELSHYERLVQNTIIQATQPYKSRLTITKEYDNNLGWIWDIMPKNPKAARVIIYGVDDITFRVNVDDIHHLEIFVKKNSWDKVIELFKAHLEAIMEGKAQGWSSNDLTTLEIDMGNNKPHRWSGNVIFISRFKKRPGTIFKQYNKY